MDINFYTDYPITELGDIPRKEAPIRKGSVLSYDGDKYATVSIEGITTDIKIGYLYEQPGRCGFVDSIPRYLFEQMREIDSKNDLVENIVDFIRGPEPYHRASQEHDLPGRNKSHYAFNRELKWSEQFTFPELAAAIREKFIKE
jgi:hypothetical protein